MPQILSTLKRNLNIPVTCKIRLLKTHADTVELARRIEKTGVAALAVHGRCAQIQSKVMIFRGHLSTAWFSSPMNSVWNECLIIVERNSSLPEVFYHIPHLRLVFRKIADRPRDPAQWDGIAEVVSALSIPVIANGDIFEYADFERLQHSTGTPFVLEMYLYALYARDWEYFVN